MYIYCLPIKVIVLHTCVVFLYTVFKMTCAFCIPQFPFEKMCYRLLFTVRNSRLCFHRCLSVHRGRCTPPAGGRHLPHLGRNPSPHQTATAADGTHPTGMHSCCYKSHIGQWRIQDFPEEGAPTHKVGLFCKPFAENCMKNKKIGPPWIRQCWLLSTFFPMNNYVITEYFVM